MGKKITNKTNNKNHIAYLHWLDQEKLILFSSPKEKLDQHRIYIKILQEKEKEKKENQWHIKNIH